MFDFVSVRSYAALSQPILQRMHILHTACLILSPVYFSVTAVEAPGLISCVRAFCPWKVRTTQMPVCTLTAKSARVPSLDYLSETC